MERTAKEYPLKDVMDTEEIMSEEYGSKVVRLLSCNASDLK